MLVGGGNRGYENIGRWSGQRKKDQGHFAFQRVNVILFKEQWENNAVFKQDQT